ncbi:MAG TPA: nucleoside phosphorylase [Gammaproteobacteria bacterium]|jgi:uridine phosphorylase|nr:nucleoside phosphorylase [Gammaproteobacteria bacterium]
MKKPHFTPHHINATPADFAGNHGIGRYVFLPGSNGRAKQISTFFDNVTVKEHPRGHHLYLGTLRTPSHTIDVASVSSGMGCPSMEIILHELYQLGAKRFLRIGTAGSLQSKNIVIGDIINVSGSVRDESTTKDYAPIEFPAMASLDMINVINATANALNLAKQTHTGVVHCKGSLYAREFGAGPNAAVNDAYLDYLTRCGVLASEMETAALLIQSQLYDHECRQAGQGAVNRVLCGAILSIFCIPPHEFIDAETAKPHEEKAITLAIESIKMLAERELAALIA